jgi:hypothetical protein
VATKVEQAPSDTLPRQKTMLVMSGATKQWVDELGIQMLSLGSQPPARPNLRTEAPASARPVMAKIMASGSGTGEAAPTSPS